jgi:RNA polymerase sigma factor (sigma-70 family)
MLKEQDGTDFALLVERCQKGDRAAWDRLVSRFSDYVYSIPRRYRLSEEDCADVFQSTFQSLYLNLDRIDSVKAIPKWLAVTAARASLQVIRVSNSRRENPTEQSDLDSMLASEEASAETAAMEASDADTLRIGLKELGGKCQTLLEALYLSESSSYDKVAEKLGMPSGAIGPTRARCLAKLRLILENRGFFG